MSARTEPQIIRDAAGRPTFAVIPYGEYQELVGKAAEEPYIPHAVVKRVVEDGVTPVRAWREHLELTQADVASRLGISQSAYAQQETAEKPRKSTLKKIADALGISVKVLDV
ncbi:helix-turn-helix domain-containing protein [Paraburkholderia kururiensis]|uniref:helix-turn-helix domain-containing protein n=1 Tax=Paraburkholderia kururiensis TaxID=984307 RepID=UPI0005A8BD22|nr:helix-turn-helix transcriptional regulator [Paraburkholderia kururiensis]